MSMYENLVMQTQMNYSKYYGRYAAGKTPVRLSDRKPLPYEKQIEKMSEKIKAQSGMALDDLTLDKVINGEIKSEDIRIAPETLEMQAQVAESVGRDAFASNLRRAAELIAVPDKRILEIYNALRPYRSTKAELYQIADELENQYNCKINAAFVREAADVYALRGRLRAE